MRYLLKSGLRSIGLVLCMAAGEALVDNPFFGAFVYLSVYVIVAVLWLSYHREDDAYSRVSSYRLFSCMRIFATAAMDLGGMMYFCHLIVEAHGDPSWRTYLTMVAWLLLVGLVQGADSLLIRRRWMALELAEFVVGAATWVLGAVFIFRASGMVQSLVWTGVWGLGIALIYSSLNRFSEAFEAVGTLSDRPLGRDDLKRSDEHQSRVGAIVSSGVMLLVMALWTFLMPAPHGEELPRVLHVSMMQLPVFFMLVAVYYAVRQPLDRRNREKLMLYIGSHTKSEHVRTNLQHMFVGKYRVRYGARILCTLARPFLHHRVSGREHLRTEDYPSVFVCNHGFLYGPIVAVLYLPTYFRPWIHNKMLQPDLAQREIRASFPWVRRVLGRKAGDALTRAVARAVCSLLRSFNPIPVVRGASHDTLSTFDLSLTALEEGDNILMFPEKPLRRNAQGQAPKADDLRGLYTGFAHIGKLYHDRTGRCLRFYPIYASRRRHAFRIGEPVCYDPSLPPRESKQAIAEALQARIEALAREGEA